jgi:peptidoglycan/LPS O-acetylase OafA/YrhL
MRFLAAFSVLVYHYFSCYHPKLAVPEGFLAAASWATRYGYLGVNAFFMISGFVILWSAMQRGPIDFLIGRISRLYPCFWFSVLLTAGVVYLFGAYAATGIPVQVSPASVAANLTMIPSYLGFGYIDDVYWTLEVELRFYALVFLMLLFRLQNRVDSLLNLWLAILALGSFFDLPGLVGFVMIDGWGQYFVAGCLFFLGHKFGWTMGRIIRLLVAA